MVKQPPYPIDLAPFNFFLFPKLKFVFHSGGGGMPRGIYMEAKGILFSRLAGMFCRVTDVLGKMYRFVGRVF